MLKRALVVVAKQPMPGKTKTRLCPPLEPHLAVELYRCFLLDTLDLMTQLEATRLIIAYTPIEAESYFQQIAPDNFILLCQVGENLGQRLNNVLTTCLDLGYQQVAVMNSDGPTLPITYLREAFTLLEKSEVDVVLGPSEDGGYYLIGMKRSHNALFGVMMSTPTVLQETMVLANELGLRTACLPAWYDVDTQDDLQRLIEELELMPDHVAPRTRQFMANWPN